MAVDWSTGGKVKGCSGLKFRIHHTNIDLNHTHNTTYPWDVVSTI